MHTDDPRELKKVNSNLPSRINAEIKNAFNKGLANLIVIHGSGNSSKSTTVTTALDLAGKENEVVSLCIAAESVSLSPENFTLEFIGYVMRGFLGSSPISQDIFDIQFLKEKLSSLKAHKSLEILESAHSELQKIKPNQRYLLELAFSFPETLAKETKKKFVIGIDDFENILDLNNFAQIKDILSVYNFKSKNPQYILTTSQRTLLEQLPEHYLFELKPINKQDTVQYIKKVIPKVTEKTAADIFEYSQGYLPLLIGMTSKVRDGVIPRQAYAQELLGKESRTYTCLKLELHKLLDRARGKTLLRTILNVLSRVGPKTLSQLAALVYRSAPVTKSLLERLIEVDLIRKEGKQFYFSNPLLAKWLKAEQLQLHFSGEISEEELEQRGGAL